LGAWLAASPDASSLKDLEKVSDVEIGFIEEATDSMETRLPDLTGFILPGGHMTAALAQVARTICRRAERRVVSLYETSSETKRADHFTLVLVYLNRLSDYLFVLARHLNQSLGASEIRWKK
jgi:cob(I)alamin adenosyltransferase